MGGSNMRWKVNGKVSTPENIFSQINTEIPQPVGIILSGADCDFKNEVSDTLTQGLRRFIVISDDVPSYRDAIAEKFQEYSIVAITIEGDDSHKHALRRAFVTEMQKAGTKTVIGIYAKCNKPAPLPGRGFLKSKTARLAKQITAIEQSNPTADDLDYFIVVEEEE